MRRPAEIAPLAALAGMIAERDLARLSAALAARQRIQALLAELEPPPPATDGEPAAELRNAAAYAAWVERRRRALAAELAEEDRRVAEARHAASTTFGRAQVLSRMAATSGRKSPRDGD